MPQRKTGFALLAAGALAMVLSMVALVVGFVASSLAPIYIAIGLSVLSGLAFLAGIVVLIVSAAK